MRTIDIGLRVHGHNKAILINIYPASLWFVCSVNNTNMKLITTTNTYNYTYLYHSWKMSDRKGKIFLDFQTFFFNKLFFRFKQYWRISDVDSWRYWINRKKLSDRWKSNKNLNYINPLGYKEKLGISQNQFALVDGDFLLGYHSISHSPLLPQNIPLCIWTGVLKHATDFVLWWLWECR